jgi:UDP-glucose 4-epimerase
MINLTDKKLEIKFIDNRCYSVIIYNANVKLIYERITNPLEFLQKNILENNKKRKLEEDNIDLSFKKIKL